MYLFLWCFFMVKHCYELLKMGIQGNGWYFFAWDYKRLHQTPDHCKTHYSPIYVLYSATIEGQLISISLFSFLSHLLMVLVGAGSE